MSDCKLCEHQGYSTHLCLLHRRHSMLSEKRELSKRRALEKLDRKKALEIVAAQKKKKKFENAGIAAAVGAVVGYGGGYGGIVLLGGVSAAPMFAAPLVIGATIIGTAIGAIVSLTHSTKKKKSVDEPRKLLSVFGIKGYNGRKRKECK